MAEKVSDPAPAARSEPALITRSDDPAVASIQAHNQQLLSRTGQQLELALVVLTEQRDATLRQLATAEQRAEQQRAELCEEQERFITFLMEDYDQKVDTLTRELAQAKQELERRRALTSEPQSQRAGAVASAPENEDNAALVEQIDALKQLLEAAQAEVEDTNADAVRLQEERDEAIRATDDLRLEMVEEVDAARDETFQLQTQLDEALRAVEDARDEARDEAYRASEERAELQRVLDERNDEVRRLRARLADRTNEIKPSQPPPPAAFKELEAARQENQSLRKQLIDAKRELSRASREAGMSRTGRGRRSGSLAIRSGAVEGKPASKTPHRGLPAVGKPGADGARPTATGPAELRPVAKPASASTESAPARPSGPSPQQPTKPS